MRQKKQENYRKNEAAVILQRNFAPKYRSMNIARVVRVTFRAIGVMGANVAEDLMEELAEEMIANAIRIPAHEKLNEEWPLYLKSVDKAKELCIESELNILLEIAANEWIEDQLRAIAKEKERLVELQELLLMYAEDVVNNRSKEKDIEEDSSPALDVKEEENTGDLEEPAALMDEVEGDTFNEEQQPGSSAISGRTPRSVRSVLASPGRQAALLDEDEDASASRRSSFMSIVSFPDEGMQPEFNLANSVANFVSKIASKIMQRTVLSEAQLAESDRRSTRSLEEDDKSTARSLVSFQGDDSNSAYSFRGSVRDFVTKISDKVITKVMSPDAASISLRNNSLKDEGGEGNELLGNPIDESLFHEESLSGPSVDPALQLTTSISDFVVAIAEQSLIEPSAYLLADSIVQGGEVVHPMDTGLSTHRSQDTKSISGSDYTGPLSSRSLISKPEGTHTASVELQESVSDEAMPVAVDMSLSQETIVRLYTKDIKEIRLSESQKDKIEFSIEASLRFFAYAQYQQSVQCLDLAGTILASIPAEDHTHNEYVTLRALITLIKANNFFIVAAYEEAKVLYENVLSSRLRVFGGDHMLVAEAQYHCAEWHRSQANYKLAEDFYSIVRVYPITSLRSSCT